MRSPRNYVAACPAKVGLAWQVPQPWVRFLLQLLYTPAVIRPIQLEIRAQQPNRQFSSIFILKKPIWAGLSPTHMITFFYLSLSGLFVVAVPAVNRLIAARLKRNFRLFAAAAAGGGIHLAGTSVAVAASAFITKPLGSSG